MNEYPQYDALALAALIRSGEVSAVEVVEAAIARAEAMNPVLNAIVASQYDRARERAAGVMCDETRPFAGIPLLLKDGMAERGQPAPAGSRLRVEPAGSDSELLRRYRAAGFNVMGRTNMPEWGLCAATNPLAYGPCTNPHDSHFNAGGSSGGAAAAVAAGIVPVAGGGDGAGSIRIPASCCGIFGFKPTRRLTPNGPGLVDVWGGLVAQHVLTRSVRDSAAVLDASAGPEPGSSLVARGAGRYLDAVGTNPGRLRIAWSTAPMGDARIDSACVTAAREAAELCAAMGHEVEEMAPELDNHALKAACRDLIAASAAADLAETEGARNEPIAREELEDVTWLFVERGRRLTALDLLAAERVIQRETQGVGAFFAEYDVYLTPTLATPPPRLRQYGMSGHDCLERYLDELFAFIPFTPLANVTGQPAMSVPLAQTVEGLPIGVHFSAAPGADGLLFSLAAQMESARPWMSQLPLA